MSGSSVSLGSGDEVSARIIFQNRPRLAPRIRGQQQSIAEREFRKRGHQEKTRNQVASNRRTTGVSLPRRHWSAAFRNASAWVG